MRVAIWTLTTVVALTASTRPKADDTTPRSDLERLARSRVAWERARDAAGGTYSYEMHQVILGSRATTKVVVEQGKVVERSFTRFVGENRPAPPGGANVWTTGWTEKGADLGTHGDGAAPPLTVDELYDEAAKVLTAPQVAFRQRSLGLDDRGLLRHCFEFDARIADGGPLDGVRPFQITLGTK